MTIAEALDTIALRPHTTRGDRVAPIVYTSGCAPLACGACTILASGRPSAACTTLVSEVAPKRGALVLEPQAKLGVVRDLLVDDTNVRTRIARLGASVPDASGLPNAAAALAFADPDLAFALSRCTRCGACIQACPETRAAGGFVGAAAVAASRLVDLHGSGARARDRRHAALSEPGGIHECGQAQNCLEVCPEGLPLDDVLALAARAARASFFGRLFAKTAK
jgi:succinate dehydrogenase / fumarate reductase iron-sulfur subunit